LRIERKESSLALNSQVFGVGYNLYFVDGPASQAIRSAKNLDWTNEIKFLYGWHDHHDNSSSLEARASVLARS
jgi:hypothetical protein